MQASRHMQQLSHTDADYDTLRDSTRFMALLQIE
jgi:hypothetical protein